MIIAGIDEAGLGPVLGPLVVTTAAFRLPDNIAEESLWGLLSPAVSRRPSRKRMTVAIDDSKKLYSRQNKAGLKHLELAVLGMLAASGRWPDSFRELLSVLAPESVKTIDGYPWYEKGDLALPRCTSTTQAAFAGNLLSAAMESQGLRLEAIRCEPVLVGQFNRMVGATRNKSTALFDITSRLLMYLWKRASQPMRIYVDRHGGRKRYLPALQRVFSNCQFKVLAEDETASAYALTDGTRHVEICFVVGGERLHLPVALASMASKYLRELFMEMLNGFWCPHVPGLEPTAGYYKDGRRFFGEISPAMQRLGIDKQLLYRCR